MTLLERCDDNHVGHFFFRVSTFDTDKVYCWLARMNKSAQLLQAYGQTENGGPVLDPVPEGPSGNLGKPTPTYQIKCYYNNPKATAEAFSEDGYYKTGDLVYRDENDYYFFVIPPEVEEVILMHDGVADVCVTGVPHPDDGELVVACVVRKPGSTVTAKEIKDLVANAHVDDDDDDGDDDDGGGGDSDDCDTRNVFDQYVVKHK
ncbi:hypothetical protein MSG28_005656, partial [Choristoneura fumiferana]